MRIYIHPNPKSSVRDMMAAVFSKPWFLTAVIILSILFSVLVRSTAIGQEEGMRGTNEVPAQLTDFRFGVNPDNFRIVADLTGSPEYSVQTLEDTSRIVIDLFDTQLDPGFSRKSLPKDNLLKQYTIREYNFRQVRAEIVMNYGVPPENVRVTTLKNPNRLVIDVIRDYRQFQQIHITPNVLWTQLEQAAGGRFMLINELFINHKSSEVTLDVETAQKSANNRETVDSMVKRTGAVAGINGGYFSNNGEHMGIVVKGGKLVAPMVRRRPPRTVLGFDSKKNVFIDRVEDKNGNLVTLLNQTWKDIVTAVGGGPRLLAGGKPRVNAEEEGLGKGGNDITRRAGRTAVGVDKRGNLVMMTVSGYHDNHKDGVFLHELAHHMAGRGVQEAVNMDGGGSTAMSIRGTNVGKSPMSGSYQRPVTNAVLVYDKSESKAPHVIRFDPEEIVLPADGKSSQMVRITVEDPQGNPVPDGTLLRIAAGPGLFTKMFHTLRKGSATVAVNSRHAAGDYRIRFDSGPARGILPVKLIAGEPKFLDKQAKDVTIISTTSVTGKPGDRQISSIREKQFIIKALLRDEFKNPVSGQTIEYSLLEGEGTLMSGQTRMENNSTQVLTGSNGEASATFTLKSKKAKIRISSGNLTAVTCDIE